MKIIANRKNSNGEDDCIWLRGEHIRHGAGIAGTLRSVGSGHMIIDYFQVNGNTWSKKYNGYAPGSLLSFTI